MIMTYQDLLAVGEEDEKRMAFVRNAIAYHKSTPLYSTAEIADKYYRHQNVTINEYQKLLYKVTGEVVPDNWSANFKMACRHFHRFVLQENQYLLGNGVSWNNADTDGRLGNRKYSFDGQLQKMGKNALVHGVSFGFFNLDHIDVFSLLEFVPLWDEENGSLSAGIRFWQIANNKPIRATLYEIDGYTDYIWKSDGTKGTILHPKRPYKIRIMESVADGEEIYDGDNYPGFPIVPMWGNMERQSEIVGLREQIDCYDLIKSGFANTVDESSLIYWTIQNAGGMDDVDLSLFIDRMRKVHAAALDDDGAKAESHTIEPPVASREALLERLDRDLYRDAMALDPDRIAGGAVTATQIRASYEALNSKADEFETCVNDFIDNILEIAGIEDTATFTRSTVINVTEEIQSLLQAAQYLDSDYVTQRILALFGDSDKLNEMLDKMDAVDMSRFTEGEE